MKLAEYFSGEITNADFYYGIPYINVDFEDSKSSKLTISESGFRRLTITHGIWIIRLIRLSERR